MSCFVPEVSFLIILNNHTVRRALLPRKSDGSTWQRRTFRSCSNYAQHSMLFPRHITSYTKPLMRTRRNTPFLPRILLAWTAFWLSILTQKQRGEVAPQRLHWSRRLPYKHRPCKPRVGAFELWETPVGKQTSSWGRKNHQIIYGWQKGNMTSRVRWHGSTQCWPRRVGCSLQQAIQRGKSRHYLSWYLSFSCSMVSFLLASAPLPSKYSYTKASP